MFISNNTNNNANKDGSKDAKNAKPIADNKVWDEKSSCGSDKAASKVDGNKSSYSTATATEKDGNKNAYNKTAPSKTDNKTWDENSSSHSKHASKESSYSTKDGSKKGIDSDEDDNNDSNEYNGAGVVAKSKSEVGSKGNNNVRNAKDDADNLAAHHAKSLFKPNGIKDAKPL